MNLPSSLEGVKEPQVRRIRASDGDPLALLGTISRIKVSSQDTFGTFFVGEATLPPNAFVPLHYHHDVEVFFALKGTLEVMRLSDGEAEFLPITSGEMALVPSNAVHGFRNSSARSRAPPRDRWSRNREVSDGGRQSARGTGVRATGR
jgi:mannose-6-phosphate isomerase-like protein (cupin superfamily)